MHLRDPFTDSARVSAITTVQNVITAALLAKIQEAAQSSEGNLKHS